MRKIFSRFVPSHSKVTQVDTESDAEEIRLPAKSIKGDPPNPIDKSHIEVERAKEVLSSLLKKSRAVERPNRMKRTASQVFDNTKSRAASIANPGELEEVNNNLEPCIIDDIRILRELGSGSFGSVWKGINTKTGEKVAIKKILGQGFQAQAKFLKEAEILRMSNHPNVLRFVGLFVKQGGLAADFTELLDEVDPQSFDATMSIYLCTEYCKGGDLTRLLNDKNVKEIPFSVRLGFALDIARGLKYLHANNVVHRDIKGENVLLRPSRKVNMKNWQKEMLQRSVRQKRMISKTQGRRKRGVKVGNEEKKEKPKLGNLISPLRQLNFMARDEDEDSENEPPLAHPRIYRRIVKTSSMEECSVDGFDYHASEHNVDYDANEESDSDDSEYVKDEERHMKMLMESRAVLADVGLARMFKANVHRKQKQQAQQMLNLERLTIRGTTWTMAPELINNRTSYTTSSDVYSLGMVFIELSIREQAAEIPRKNDMFPDFDEIDKRYIDPIEDVDDSEKGSHPPQSHSLPVDFTDEEMETERALIKSNTDVEKVVIPKNQEKLYLNACPPEFRELTMRCVATDPSSRPTAREIARELDEIVRLYRKNSVNKSFQKEWQSVSL